MNEWRISEALTSVRRLGAVLLQMTEDEVVRAIALEEESLRRSSILQRLRRRARVLNRATHEAALERRINQEK